jgi:NADH-quinone oxidoreductase subunit E/NADP-reducing hydrogenase subunit HndA
MNSVPTGAGGAEWTPEKTRELDARIEKVKDKTGAAIRAMSAAQEIFGYLPREAMIRIAEGLGVPPVDIYGIASFYSYFVTAPPAGHTIVSCQGTACYVRGGNRVLEEVERTLGIKTGETTPDGGFSIQSVRCMGACALAPVVRIDSDIHSRISQRSVKGLLSRYSQEDPGDR